MGCDQSKERDPQTNRLLGKLTIFGACRLTAPSYLVAYTRLTTLPSVLRKLDSYLVQFHLQ